MGSNVVTADNDKYQRLTVEAEVVGAQYRRKERVGSCFLCTGR